MERRDLYEDDLTEERQPSPADRDAVAASETLDPDMPDGTPMPTPRASTGDDEEDGDDEDGDDDEDDDDEEDEELGG